MLKADKLFYNLSAFLFSRRSKMAKKSGKCGKSGLQKVGEFWISLKGWMQVL